MELFNLNAFCLTCAHALLCISVVFFFYFVFWYRMMISTRRGVYSRLMNEQHVISDGMDIHSNYQ